MTPDTNPDESPAIAWVDHTVFPDGEPTPEERRRKMLQVLAELSEIQTPEADA